MTTNLNIIFCGTTLALGFIVVVYIIKQRLLVPRLHPNTTRAKSATRKLSVRCKHCGKVNRFDQPYAYHAGFSDQGFLYNDAGTLTLVWSVWDPVFNEILPEKASWTHSPLNRQCFEERLLPAPEGGLWRFSNPARCTHCKMPISGSMLDTIVYLVYPGSILTNDRLQLGLREYLKPAA